MPRQALTIPNPWFNYIANGLQTLYTQESAMDYRGPLLLHASHVKDDEWYEYDRSELDLMMDRELPRMTFVRNGRLACYAELVDSFPLENEAEFARLYTRHFDLEWFHGKHAWKLARVRRFATYVVTEDRPGLWEVPDELRHEVWSKNQAMFAADEGWEH